MSSAVSIDPDTLNDIEALRELIVAERVERDRALVCRDTKIAALLHELARYKRWLFAARSEKMDPTQRVLFEEQAASDLAALEQQIEQASDVASKPALRGVPKREALPTHLPRVEVRHDLQGCTCQACGAALTKIGEDVREQLDCEPIRFFVQRHVRSKYACRACELVRAGELRPQLAC
jgi:ferric-dicitrate binding protein FerR (iron transport regulator)